MEKLFLPLGGGNEIGASSYYLQIGDDHILIDAGARLHSQSLYPDYSSIRVHTNLSGLAELDAVFISHGHLDHIGSLPMVYFEAPHVPIYTTSETKDIIRMQLDTSSRNGLDDDSDRDFQLQLLSQVNLDNMLFHITEKAWGETVHLKSCSVTFYRAGHILGASMIHIASDEGNLLFTGDYSHFDQFTVPRYHLPHGLPVDVLITEQTYGFAEDRSMSLEEQRALFCHQISDVLQRRGKVLIPSFAIGRSQEVALVLQRLMEDAKLPAFPVYIDGLAAAAAEIYEKHGVPVYSSVIRKPPKHMAYSPHSWEGVVIASSGMLLDGSTSARYAERLLPDSRNAVFFTGFMDDESPGGRLNRLKNHPERFYLNQHPIDVMASVCDYRLSAHVDRAGILDLVGFLNPETVITVHGFPQTMTKYSVIRDLQLQFAPRINIFQAVNGMPIYL